MQLESISQQVCWGGRQGFFSHVSAVTGTTMRFAAFIPPQADDGKVPVLYYLAGLTCTEETATTKAGAQRIAAQHGVALIMPDTSPRGADIDGEDEDWDLGTGAGFYLDATREPWSGHYRMYSYITEELPALVNASFPVDAGAAGIFGHSMGGHGALTIGLKQPEQFRSISAFAPICAPMQCPWGVKAFTNYLGENRKSWRAYDATELVSAGSRTSRILIDQGDGDQFLVEQLRPHLFSDACQKAGQTLSLRMQAGYDHSYYFIQSFMPDHIAHHAAILKV